ncbi:helix-turn-helix domain-containing protein [Dactylosporangium sp. NPDC048998]|uniref:helix-turn-helix domain-containing protein n=1 Tax=Dactylosporangium sp. NPDC048998 TaxID=3363976 RepID=UPI003711AFC0
MPRPGEARVAVTGKPALDRLFLRRALRAARDATGHTQAEVADAMGWSSSKLLRIESGQFGIRMNDLVALLDFYKISDEDEVTRLRGYAPGSRVDDWDKYRHVLKPEYRAYLSLEGIATRIRHFHPIVVPGLLQTPGYVRRGIEAFAPPGTDPDVQQLQRAARLQRQEQILAAPDSPDVHFILDEAVIRRIADNTARDDVHRGQLEHLLAISRRPGITLQVLPFDRSLYPGMGSPFTILDLPDGDTRGDYIYLEQSRANSALRDERTDVDQYHDIFATLSSLALSPEGTAALITKLLAGGD